MTDDPKLPEEEHDPLTLPDDVRDGAVDPGEDDAIEGADEVIPGGDAADTPINEEEEDAE